ncbi:MAG: DUF3619 family protein [Wenzhouxiangellaceae bacterium]|nr:DUF3619 family protein [Wenzhouxiangellaceae bacterium]
MNSSDDRLTDRIVESLESRSRGMDAAMRERLDAARRRALEARRPAPGRRWIPALAVAATAAAVALAILVGDVDRPAPAPMSTDLDLLTRDDYELFVDEPGFYAWLAEEPDLSSTDQPGGEETS